MEKMGKMGKMVVNLKQLDNEIHLRVKGSSCSVCLQDDPINAF